MKPYLHELHELCDVFIDSYCLEEFKELSKLLDDISDNYFKAYGTQNGSEAFTMSEEFKKNKIGDMYYRLGNAILAECKALIKEKRKRDTGFSKR